MAQQVVEGKKTTTWRLFDDKDLSVNDAVELIDKVKMNEPQSWQVIGNATITSVIEKRLRDVSAEDLERDDEFDSTDNMLATFKGYYGSNITPDTHVKIVQFDFRKQGDTAVPSSSALRVKEVKVFADGGSRGNPGPSASGYVLLDTNDTVLVDKGVYLGVTTNNQAEYTALKLALEEALAMGIERVDVYMDSLLVINQLKGIFKVKNRDLWPIHDAIQRLARQFAHISFTHVPRELNKLADAAVNRALDEQVSIKNSQKLS